MSFRKEKKFRLSISDFHQLQSLLISQGMSTLHEPRIINSLYYDTPNLIMFHNSEEGVLPRKKIRIRWYNKNLNFIVEKKISSIEGRFKTITPLGQYKNVMPLVSNNIELNFPVRSFFDEIYGFLIPTLLVSYKRAYFEFKKIRITFDSKITYKNLRISNQIKIEDTERVMEVKFGIDNGDDLLENLIPYTSSRFSKYSRGILFTNKNNK
jgi:SPX domain protein involved in polyphosphate accumulation